ncbi:MAG: hypothetical protein WC877_01265 [Dehalococcoidales bacterium]|jgi:hypothetical protein
MKCNYCKEDARCDIRDELYSVYENFGCDMGRMHIYGCNDKEEFNIRCLTDGCTKCHGVTWNEMQKL